MTFRTFLWSICLLFTVNYSAQPYFNWGLASGNSEAQGSYDVIWTMDEAMLHAGFFESQLEVGPVPVNAIGLSDGYVAKSDGAGNPLWARTYGSTGEDEVISVAETPTGEYYVLGSFSDTVITTIDTLIAHGGTDVFLMKLSSSGEELWSFTIGGALDDRGFDCAVDPQGRAHIIFEHRVVSYYESATGVDSLVSVGQKDIGAIKLDADGEVIWKRSIGSVGPSDNPKAIAVDSAGKVFLFGSFRNTVDFDPGPGVDNETAIGRDVFLCKLDSMGNHIFAHRMGQASEDGAYDIALRGDDIIMTGFFKGEFDAQGQGGVYLLESNGHFDIYVIKIKTNGVFQWATSTGHLNYDSGLSVDMDSEGNVYTTGVFTDQADLDPGPDTLLYTGAPAVLTTYIQKLNPDGELIYATTFPSAVGAFLEGMDVSESGSIAMAGVVQAPIDLGPYDEEIIIDTEIGPSAILLARFEQCPVQAYQAELDQCGSYLWGDTLISQSGVYEQTFTSSGGCDSVVQLTFTLLQETSADIALTGCDSVSVNGAVYFDSGFYEQILTNSQGCDSTLSVAAEVLASSTSLLTEFSCGPFELNGISYEATGLYEQIFVNQVGCDSVVSLDLTVHDPDLSLIQSGATLGTELQDYSYQWLDCANDYSVIAGETSSQFTASANGEYALGLTSPDGCVDTTICYSVTGLGLQGIQDEIPALYPNPVISTLYLEHGLKGTCAIQIYSTNGEFLFSQVSTSSRNSVDMSPLPSGLYMIRVVSANDILMSRIIKY